MLYVELRSCQTYQRLVKKGTSDPEMQEALQQLGSRCEGVSDKMLQTRDHWMRVAAEGGDYLARQDWAFQLGKTVEAYRVIEDFWLDGNASALPLMSHLAKHGISSHTAMGEPDYVRAYAFNLIYLKLDMAARAYGQSWKPPESQRLDRYIAYEQHLKQIGGYLTPQQQADAERLAIRMIRNNENCCTGTF